MSVCAHSSKSFEDVAFHTMVLHVMWTCYIVWMWLVREQDDEINNQSQLVEKLREQVVELEELIVTHRKEAESLQAEQQRVQTENDSAKDEAKPTLCLC